MVPPAASASLRTASTSTGERTLSARVITAPAAVVELHRSRARACAIPQGDDVARRLKEDNVVSGGPACASQGACKSPCSLEITDAQSDDAKALTHSSKGSREKPRPLDEIAQRLSTELPFLAGKEGPPFPALPRIGAELSARVAALLGGELTQILCGRAVGNGHAGSSVASRSSALPTVARVYLAREAEHCLLESGLLREEEADEVSGRDLKPSFGREGLFRLRVLGRSFLKPFVELRLERSSPTCHRHGQQSKRGAPRSQVGRRHFTRPRQRRRVGSCAGPPPPTLVSV